MAQLPTGLVTHSQKVCRLYKRALRCLEDWNPRRDEFRYEAVLLRQAFDVNKNIKDARIAKKLLLDAETELIEKQHYLPRKFPDSFGGIIYKNWLPPPDGSLDYWDPVEKRRYPKYFARREELKKEYEELYNKLYPPKDETDEKGKLKDKK